MNSNQEYVLDFVIPAGQPGLSSLCFVKFNNATSAGNVSINSNITLPSTSTDYRLDSNSVTINEAGYYEITFCGKINRNSANQEIHVNLRQDDAGVITNMPGMSGQWIDGSQVIHFSQTTVYQFQNPITLRVTVSITGPTNFNAEALNLIIRKLPF